MPFRIVDFMADSVLVGILILSSLKNVLRQELFCDLCLALAVGSFDG